MSLYYTIRKFIGKNFVRPFEDFCAIHCPRVYEFIFYNLRHETQYEDCGEAVFLRINNFENFTRLKSKNDFSLKLPLNFEHTTNKFKIAAIVHIFYTELANEIKNYLYNIPNAVDVYISTTSYEKKNEIEKIFKDFDKGDLSVNVFENCGRDIAPLIIGFKEVCQRYDVCLHIHTKESLHSYNRLFGWRKYLFENLIGSSEIVDDILQIFSNERVGIVFPQYFPPIRISINWGENYLITKDLLKKLGIKIDNRHLIEFPAGSMFWFRPKALMPLFNASLSFKDFPKECGQIDGTLAHAIEHALLFVVESSGFIWVKTCINESRGNLISRSPKELTNNIYKAWYSVLKQY